MRVGYRDAGPTGLAGDRSRADERSRTDEWTERSVMTMARYGINMAQLRLAFPPAHGAK